MTQIDAFTSPDPESIKSCFHFFSFITNKSVRFPSFLQLFRSLLRLVGHRLQDALMSQCLHEHGSDYSREHES